MNPLKLIPPEARWPVIGFGLVVCNLVLSWVAAIVLGGFKFGSLERRVVRPVSRERHGDFLVSHAGDMRDVMLASPAGDFFTRHHYGRGRFERDDAGRVVRLVYTDGPHQVVADRV